MLLSVKINTELSFTDVQIIFLLAFFFSDETCNESCDLDIYYSKKNNNYVHLLYHIGGFVTRINTPL